MKRGIVSCSGGGGKKMEVERKALGGRELRIEINIIEQQEKKKKLLVLTVVTV